MDERLDELAANVAEIRANMARTAGVETELRAELANARERAAVAETRIEAERESAEDRVAARNAVIEELRAELARLRLPFWRRWLGQE
jgi:predicted  nucleic acid-binding Zn-ribbon protein